MPVITYGKLNKEAVVAQVRNFIKNSRTKKGEHLRNLEKYINFFNSTQGKRAVLFWFPEFHKTFAATRKYGNTNIRNYITGVPSFYNSSIINSALVNKWKAAYNKNTGTTPQPRRILGGRGARSNLAASRRSRLARPRFPSPPRPRRLDRGQKRSRPSSIKHTPRRSKKSRSRSPLEHALASLRIR